MNFSLKPHPLIAHWVPGMIVLMALVLSYYQWDYGHFTATYAKEVSGVGMTILLFSLLGFVIGELLDSVRDWLLESLLDMYRTVKWEYLLTISGDQKVNFYESYFTYYVLNMNLGLALASLLAMNWRGIISLPQSARLPLPPYLLVALAMCIFWGDGWSLRKDIVRITNENNGNAAAEERRVEE